MTTVRKPGVLMLFPGPRYNVVDQFGERLSRLSENFCGELCTISNDDSQVEVKNFRITTVGHARPTSLNAAWKLLLLAYRKAKELKSSSGLDLIVTYDPTKTGLMGVLLARRFGVKLLTEINGDYASIENYIDIESSIKRRFKLYTMRMVEWFVLKNSAGAKLLYRSQIDYFRSVQLKVCETFPNHVDVKRFKPEEQKNVILFAGFPAKRKGLDLLIEAFKLARERCPGWELHIIGWFPNVEEVKELIKGNDDIKYFPPVDRSEMPHKLASSAILCLPSRSEAMGRILIEAAACGVVRLGANVGGIPTVIEDGVDGVLFSHEPEGDLCEKLSMLMSEVSLRLRLANEALKRVSEDGVYGRDAYYSKTTALYKRVIGLDF